jgi:hypothetical protein
MQAKKRAVVEKNGLQLATIGAISPVIEGEPPMSFHPAYPSATDLSREAAAMTRDRTDLAILRDLHSIVSHALDRASRCNTIQHPDRKWQTDELLDALHGALADIDDTAAMIRRSPVVLEAAE